MVKRHIRTSVKGKKFVAGKKKKSEIIIYIDSQGNKRWKWKTKKNAIYGI